MDKFGNFLAGIGATNQLINHAFESKCFSAPVCLSANQIDAFLRIGIILKNQLKNDNKDIIEELIYQGEKDRPVMEREIYERACKEGIITKSTCDKLHSLYSQRNRVVHRYIISNITTKEVEDIARKIGIILMEMESMIRELENEQLKQEKGMTKRNPSISTEQLKKMIYDSIIQKHG